MSIPETGFPAVKKEPAQIIASLQLKKPISIFMPSVVIMFRITSSEIRFDETTVAHRSCDESIIINRGVRCNSEPGTNVSFASSFIYYFVIFCLSETPSSYHLKYRRKRRWCWASQEGIRQDPTSGRARTLIFSSLKRKLGQFDYKYEEVSAGTDFR